MADEDGVRFTIKELLNAMNDKLDRIEQSLQSKADKSMVELLAQKIESVNTRIPGELIKDHAQLIMQDQLNKVHSGWVDERLKETNDKVDKLNSQLDTADRLLHDLNKTQQEQTEAVEQSQTTKRWVIGLVLANISTLAYSTYGIVHGFSH